MTSGWRGRRIVELITSTKMDESQCENLNNTSESVSTEHLWTKQDTSNIVSIIIINTDFLKNLLGIRACDILCACVCVCVY